ncbi:hypothetical protein MMC29_006616 [Sticta canariensis]|nr:hypothetical protein [Sticta canariensis]
MKCSIRHLTLGDIAKHGRTLHKLRLLDYEPRPRLHTPDTTLSIPLLDYLRRNCPFLKDLNLEFDPDMYNPKPIEWFSVPETFSRLHMVSLYVLVKLDLSKLDYSKWDQDIYKIMHEM